MGATHSDVEMLIAAQMANFDIEPGMTLGEFIAAHEGEDSETGNAIRDLQEYLNQPGAEACLDWKVVATGDDQGASGMYGCMIDDGKGDAIFAFRGSEALGDLSNPQFVKDWLQADTGLLNSTGTYQQERARQFVEKMYEQYGDQYEGFDFTGHSLGGNLAMDAAINAPAGMRDKINQIYGFDSPGFSDEYMLVHGGQIAEMRGRMTHFAWSPVGALLHMPVDTRFVDVKNPKGFGRHYLLNIRMEDGRVLPRQGNQWYWADELLLRDWSLRADSENYFDPLARLGFWISLGSKISSGINRVQHSNDPINISTDNTISICYPKMREVESIYAEAEASLKRVEGALHDIEGSLKYASVVGFLYRYKIRCATVRAEANVKAISACRGVLNEAVAEYQNTDAQVADSYNGIGLGI